MLHRVLAVLRRRRLLVGLLAFWLVAPACLAESLSVAAGAGYKRPVTELTQAFSASTGIAVETFFGNMGQVMAQASQSDRVAVVFGDQSFLEKAKALQFAHYLPAGRGRLVLAWPTGRQIAEPAQLKDAAFARIAMPDVGHAVYGKAASQFLERSGLAEPLAARLLTVATVPQVSAYLVSGEVDAGFINLTDALGVKDRIGGYLEIDPAQYDEIRIVGGVLQAHAGRPEVAALEAFLKSPEAREILQRHGL